MTRHVLVLCIITIALLTGCGQEADAPQNESDFLAEGIEVTGVPRVSICHATGLKSLPYLEVDLSEEAVTTHQQHAGDLIPAPAEGCPTDQTAVLSHTVMPTDGVAATDTTAPVDTLVPTWTNAVSGTNVPATSIPTSTAEPATAIPTVDAAATSAATPDQSCNVEQALDTALADVDGVSRFRTMLRESGLIEMIHAEQVTVFVPTDEAFDRLDAALVEEWNSNPRARNAMLLYHIIHGHRQYNSLETAQQVKSITGETIFITEIDGVPTLNGSAQFVATDLEACNDMIHVVDNVLIPPIFTYHGAGRPDRGNSNGNKNGGNDDGNKNGNGNDGGNSNGNGNGGGNSNGNGNGNGNP